MVRLKDINQQHKNGRFDFFLKASDCNNYNIIALEYLSVRTSSLYSFTGFYLMMENQTGLFIL